MTEDKIELRRLRRDEKAVSPAISSVLLTSAVVVLLLVTIAFGNNFLNARMAENEFSAMKQSMQTVGLQIDDVAWIVGRTQTIRYASRFGHVDFESLAFITTSLSNPASVFRWMDAFSTVTLPSTRPPLPARVYR